MELGGGMDGFHESDKFLETGRQTFTLTVHSTFLTVGSMRLTNSSRQADKLILQQRILHF